MFSGLLSGFKNFFASKSGGGISPESAGYRERRKLVRLRCAYEVKGNIGDKKFKATIVDIGVEGLKLRTGQHLKVGEKVVLAPPGQGVSVQALPVEGKIVWIKTTDKSYARHAGLIFTTKKEEGTGLGMSIIYGIVKRHGGDIEVESEPARGTVVTIVLPTRPGAGGATA